MSENNENVKILEVIDSTSVEHAPPVAGLKKGKHVMKNLDLENIPGHTKTKNLSIERLSGRNSKEGNKKGQRASRQKNHYIITNKKPEKILNKKDKQYINKTFSVNGWADGSKDGECNKKVNNTARKRSFIRNIFDPNPCPTIPAHLNKAQSSDLKKKREDQSVPYQHKQKGLFNELEKKTRKDRVEKWKQTEKKFWKEQRQKSFLQKKFRKPLPITKCEHEFLVKKNRKIMENRAEILYTYSKFEIDKTILEMLDDFSQMVEKEEQYFCQFDSKELRTVIDHVNQETKGIMLVLEQLNKFLELGEKSLDNIDKPQQSKDQVRIEPTGFIQQTSFPISKNSGLMTIAQPPQQNKINQDEGIFDINNQLTLRMASIDSGNQNNTKANSVIEDTDNYDIQIYNDFIDKMFEKDENGKPIKKDTESIYQTHDENYNSKECTQKFVAPKKQPSKINGASKAFNHNKDKQKPYQNVYEGQKPLVTSQNTTTYLQKQMAMIHKLDQNLEYNDQQDSDGGSFIHSLQSSVNDNLDYENDYSKSFYEEESQSSISKNELELSQDPAYCKKYHTPSSINKANKDKIRLKNETSKFVSTERHDNHLVSLFF